ncbi:MAG: ion transporter [Actinomycetaceae bacterium]|nr:ion transporter [Actinomycetaceae bacterium]
MSSSANSWRHRLDRWVHSERIQNLVMAVILINSITIGLETAVSHDSALYTVLHFLDLAALVIFTAEIAVKMVALGPVKFFSRGWNVFDFAVVAIALAPGAGPLSVLRTLRILRLLRVIKFMPSLRRVVEALLMSLPGLTSIAILIGIIFYVAAVMSTVMFGHDFPELFGNLGASTFTLFQVMTLEGWADGIVRPIMEQIPWAWAFFVPFILISAFTMLNLFVAVIVDTMSNLAPVAPTVADIKKKEGDSDDHNDEDDGETSPRASVLEQGEVTNIVLLEEIKALREEIAVLKKNSVGVATATSGD